MGLLSVMLQKMAKKKNESIEQLFEKLRNIADEFEAGEIEIEDGAKKYKEALEIANEIKKRLTRVENEIKEVKGDQDSV